MLAGAGDVNRTGLQWLTQHLQYLTIELRQLIQKQHAMMCLADFTGAWLAAAANQRRSGCTVMGRAKGAGRPGAQRRAVADRLNRRDLECFLLRKWRQNAGQTAGQQGLAGSGWPEQQQIVTAACGDDQRPFGLLLSLYVGEVGMPGWL